MSLTAWAWTSQADLDPIHERSEVWINPHLPRAELRVLHPLCVEISVNEDFAAALHHVQHFFAPDAVLAAILRLDDVCRFLLYTTLSQPRAYERCREMRESFRPTSIGWRVAIDPGWDGLVRLTEPMPASGVRRVPLGAGGSRQ